MPSPLITSSELADRLGEPTLVVVDCRHQLADPDWGAGAYRSSHIPGAVFAHLDHDLSGAKNGRNGRHPLPQPDDFCATMGRLGVGPGVDVVAYDQHDGMMASRLWWLLRAYGHESVRVLDGGLAAWETEGRPVSVGVEERLPTTFTGKYRSDWAVEANELLSRWMNAPDRVIIDARAPERYRGEVEPIDPVAGRVPGARNQPYKANVDAAGRFLSPDALRARYQELLGGLTPEQAVTYCGSGVSGAHDVLAMEIAGLPGAKLYPGSWSEWCADPACPVERDAV